MSEVILRANVPLNHLISSPYDTENVSRRKIYGTLEKRIFLVPFIVRNHLPYMGKGEGRLGASLSFGE